MTNPTKPLGDVATIVTYFGVRGKAAVDAMRPLTKDDKAQLAEGIRNGTLNY